VRQDSIERVASAVGDGATVMRLIHEQLREHQSEAAITFTVQVHGAANTIPFTGILAHKPLAPGSYKLTATPTDNAHNKGQPRTAKLAITAK
jgi:hypothetical protein